MPHAYVALNNCFNFQPIYNWGEKYFLHVLLPFFSAQVRFILRLVIRLLHFWVRRFLFYSHLDRRSSQIRFYISGGFFELCKRTGIRARWLLGGNKKLETSVINEKLVTMTTLL